MVHLDVGWMAMRTYIYESNVSFVEANGLRFGFLSEGDGPLVLLMHGFPDTPHTWDHVRPALAAAGYRAVSPFMRGYAPTSIPACDAYKARDLGTDVLALIHALGYESAILVGHDWGALAVYAAAHLAPERVDKLVVVGLPHPRTLRPSLANAWKLRHFFAFKLPWATRRFRRNDFRQVDVLYRRWSPAWNVPLFELEAAKNVFAAPGSAHAALGYYRSIELVPPDFMKVPIRVPTLVFAGLTDLVAPDVYVQGKRMFANAYRVECLPGGHFMHRESPGRFAKKLLEFVQEG
jgi:pimeloyl-ACP methyl ester carboxylesterase